MLWNQKIHAAAAAKSRQSCPTLCNPIDCSPPGSPVPGILQARTLEWVAIVLLQCLKVKSEREVAQSCPSLGIPWTAGYQAPPSMGFSRQKYWSGSSTGHVRCSLTSYSPFSTPTKSERALPHPCTEGWQVKRTNVSRKRGVKP